MKLDRIELDIVQAALYENWESVLGGDKYNPPMSEEEYLAGEDMKPGAPNDAGNAKQFDYYLERRKAHKALLDRITEEIGPY